LTSDRGDKAGAFPRPLDQVAGYTALRTGVAPVIDGRLDDECWINAPRSSRFVDLISGAPTVHDTRVAVLWDDDNLYVGFWVEEPFVEATLTERDSLIYNDNDVEVFVAGRDAYYELEVNALGTIYEVLFVWEDSLGDFPGFDADMPGARPWNGVGFTTHPRGPRVGFWEWDFPGLRWGVAVDGTLNDNRDRDRGWTAEIALPWEGMRPLAAADGRSLPPEHGDVWRISFSRFNQYREAPTAVDSGGWALSAHGVWDSHIPELFPHVSFSTRLVDQEV
jgi:hypothetical protein